MGRPSCPSGVPGWGRGWTLPAPRGVAAHIGRRARRLGSHGQPIGSPHARGGRHRRHLHGRGGRRRPHREGALDPPDPSTAVRRGLGAVTADRPELLAHGTTVATNALLEGKGAPIALVTTAGLRDVIEIGRQDRPSLYDTTVVRPDPLVPRAWRLEVTGRLAADGSELEPVGDLPDIPREVEAVAVCLLHADLASGPRAAGRGGAAGQGLRRQLLVRGVSRDARVRAHADDGRERRAATPLPALPATACPAWPTRCSS